MTAIGDDSYTNNEIMLLQKNAAFWNETPYGFSKDRRFGGKYLIHHITDNQRAGKIFNSNSVASHCQPFF
jgi:hypothetical protein